MSQASFYVQTGKTSTFMAPSPDSSNTAPASARAVRYNQSHQPANSESDSSCRTGSILKKPKLFNAPSALSMVTSEADLPKAPLSRPPTYQLGPAKDKNFPHLTVKQMTEDILAKELSGEVYDQEKSKQQMKKLTEIILSSVKQIPMDRYKIVCNILICQKLGQGIQTASRCAWDEKLDCYTSAVYENKSLYAVATIYGIYAE